MLDCFLSMFRRFTLLQQVEKLKEQLKQSGQLNVGLKNQLDDSNSLHMQNLAKKDDFITDLTRQIDSLQTQLDNTRQTFSELERRLQDANSRLEYYATSLNGSHDDTLLEREQELEILKHELDELRRIQARNDRNGSDMAAQTSPLKDWTQGSSDKLRDLERRLEESAQTNEQYKNILEEKELELQQLKAMVSKFTLSHIFKAFCRQKSYSSMQCYWFVSLITVHHLRNSQSTLDDPNAVSMLENPVNVKADVRAKILYYS